MADLAVVRSETRLFRCDNGTRLGAARADETLFRVTRSARQRQEI
jgi:hypothetical protein